MTARQDRGRLLEALAIVAAELGGDHGEGRAPRFPDRWSRAEPIGGILDEDAEALLRELVGGLTRVAGASADRAEGREPKADAVAGAIGGAEILIRSELISGRGDRLAGLLPGFVYMVTLPHLDQHGALALSRRTEELLAERPSGAG